MKRLIDYHLERWKDSSSRKPLLIRGARQVGKTFAVRKLGKKFDHFIEVNFELTPEAKLIFDEKKDLQPERILGELGALFNKKFMPGKTLLFFDEIQVAPRSIIALRYFYELMPALHVIAAGSLVDFAVEEVGMPVGRISNYYLYPVSFVEFLAATNNQLLIEVILNHEGKDPLAEVIHNKLMNLLGQYMAIGGMPESIVKWVKLRNPVDSFQVQHDIIAAYRQDFQTYAKKHQIKYVELLFKEIPHLVAKQFNYKNIHEQYRKRELEPSLDLLCKANVFHKIYHSSGHFLPLGAEVNHNWFKVIFLDVALCQTILGFDLSTWIINPGIEFINQGSIVEAFVGQELLCYSPSYQKAELFFWQRIAKNSTAEIDYLYPYKDEIIPIEVKKGATGTLRSLHLFLEEHTKSPFGIRFSTQNYSFVDKIDSRPLYSVVSLAHNDQKESLKSLMIP